MPNNVSLKAIPLITAVLLLAILATPVFATGAHLWFYSIEPPIPLPDPETWDPNYSGTDPDGWLNEGLVIQVGDWTDFSCWIGNADPHDDCEDLRILISVNTEAAAGIASMKINGYDVTLPWDSDDGNFPMPPHSPIGDADWAGFAEVSVGSLDSGNKMELTFTTTLNTGADMDDARIHLDAYCYDADGWPFPIFAPFSHDGTFVIPEAATIFAVTSSLLALGIYAYKRKKQ
jgi:hypothetical protein